MGEPSITTTVEPRDGRSVSFLKCAPPSAGGDEVGHLNLLVRIVNTGPEPMRIIAAEVKVLNSSTPAQPWMFQLPPPDKPPKPTNGVVTWTQGGDHVFQIPPGALSLRARIWTDTADDPHVINSALSVHTNPTPQGSYRFWGAVRDLRPGEFWQVHGTAHGQAGPQLFAYDVGVAVESGFGYSGVLPNTDGTANEHSRIWGKPVYAIADGKVVHYRNDFPTNPRPLQSGEKYEETFPDLYEQYNALGDGNGNFFTIATGDETVLYAHMQPGSLNPDLLHEDAAVKVGDYLGRVGNSGASSGPHLHIHANKTIAGDAKSWDNAPRPMRFRNAHAVAWDLVGVAAASAPWVKLNGRGIPATDCAIWPSDAPVVDLRDTQVRHFAISEQGQLWVIRNTDGGIWTSNDRLPGSGFYLDVNPGGIARHIALVDQKPYLIGANGRLFEGTPGGWIQTPNSPELKQFCVDTNTDRIWATTESNDIVAFDPVAKVWTPRNDGGKGKDICARNGVVHLIGMDDHIYRSTGTSGWTQLPGQGLAKRITVDGSSGKLWVIGWNDGIWSHGGGGNWTEHPGSGVGTDIRIHQGTPYIVGTDWGLWRSAGAAGWERINVVEVK